MDSVIAEHISGLDFGQIQEFKGITILPLFSTMENSVEYLTLKEALEDDLIVVKEISPEGSVQELKVVNNSDIPVLLLDGEELIGAKQNRVLNTTILVKEQAETIIPVSCTEQGRWSYTSQDFVDSEVVASHNVRKAKSASVSESLKHAENYRSDQRAVWQEIREMSDDAGVRSRTCAMRDVYESKDKDLHEYLDAFQPVDGQNGLLVFINGDVAGLDIVSSSSAYKILHEKLVKSYALDALQTANETHGSADKVLKAHKFLDKISRCKESRHKSVGYGWDYRVENDSALGSALVYKEKVIHTAFFSIERGGNDNRIGMAGYRRRMDFKNM